MKKLSFYNQKKNTLTLIDRDHYFKTITFSEKSRKNN